MRRNRNFNKSKNSIRKERIIMMVSSAFVLTALTMTGIYMKGNETEQKDNGYTLDFTALEDSAEDKMQEIAQNDSAASDMGTQVADNSVQNHAEMQPEVTEDDLDYMPMEVGSAMVEIPGLTDEAANPIEEGISDGLTEDMLQEVADAENAEEQEASASDVIVEKALSFSEAEGLLRPVSGEVLLPYSMDKSIYFTTLDQYKYNPAMIIGAAEGTDAIACAEGKVIDVFTDAEIGNAVKLELGDGYEAIYGQLQEVTVAEGDYINAGEVLGAVASPTKYFSAEGSNLYFKLTKDGTPVNPEGMFQ